MDTKVVGFRPEKIKPLISPTLKQRKASPLKLHRNWVYKKLVPEYLAISPRWGAPVAGCFAVRFAWSWSTCVSYILKSAKLDNKGEFGFFLPVLSFLVLVFFVGRWMFFKKKISVSAFLVSQVFRVFPWKFSKFEQKS